jgi:divalent metal cation (Fe/Co/Zn/Cd) transporter
VIAAPLSLRTALVRRAILLETAVISYNVLEGAIAVIAGVAAGSIALVGFGLDSGIEVSASIAVLLHLWRHGQAEEESVWEQRVAIFVGLTLLVLAAYIGIEAVLKLINGSRPDESYIGIGLAIASLTIMPFVSRLEHTLSHKINSRALEAESRETLICSWLSAALLFGLGANALFGWWWADPAAALFMVAFIAREGWEAFTRRELCCID